MASRLFNPGFLHRTPLLFATVGVSTALIVPQILLQRRRYALRLDSSPSSVSPKDWSFRQYQSDAETPLLSSNGGLNPRAVRQLSAGSIIGKSGSKHAATGSGCGYESGVYVLIATCARRSDRRAWVEHVQQTSHAPLGSTYSRRANRGELRHSHRTVQADTGLREEH